MKSENTEEAKGVIPRLLEELEAKSKLSLNEQESRVLKYIESNFC
jgi:hypothetical protein